MKFRAKDKASVTMNATDVNTEGFRIGGIFNFECRDANQNLLWTEEVHNLVTNVGLDNVLDVYLHATAATATWYVGLKGAGAVVAGDTLASHSNWTEFTDYTGDRQAYVEGAASGQSIDNSGSPAAFPITDTGTVAGAFLASVATTTSGVLFAAVDFSASRSVTSGDTINVTYTISCADDGV